LDVLALFAPLTEQTRHVIGREELDILGGRNPLLVNMSRGQIVVEEEMVAALKDGRLFGAALDTVDVEPLPQDSELWSLPNVAVTPHMSWAYDRYIEDCLEILAENLDRFESGKNLVNEIPRN
jgi:phosphoglycerate dehydrogenase-like enzyme